MRSSVVETRPPGHSEPRSSNTLLQPVFQSPYTDPQFQRVQPATRKSPDQHRTLTPGEGWFALLLLTIAVYCVVFAIISANWVSNSYVLLLSTAIGLLLGLCIAKIQRFPQAILHLAAVLVGHWFSIWLTSVFAFHIPWLLLLENLRSVISGGFTAAPSTNSEMVFLFYLTFLSFFLGYFGAWLIYRARLPWLVALVYCAIMLVNLNYIKQDLSLVVVIMLGALILLIARLQLVNQLAQWTNEGLYTDRVWLKNITRQFVQVGSCFTLLVLLIAWILPVLAQPVSGSNLWNNLDNAWANLTHGQLLLTSPGTLFQPYQPSTDFFGDQLTISGSVNLSKEEVLSYTTTSSQPQYLAGFTYDHFDGHTWTSTSNESQQFAAKAQLNPVDAPGNFNQVTTSVTLANPPGGTKHYLYGPMQPASFSVPTALYGNAITTAWTQQNPFTSQESYQVTSNISTATAQDLSTVPLPQNNQRLWSNDPNFSTLNQYYLQTPPDLSKNPIIQSTLQEWTNGPTSVYDAMTKLVSHLSKAPFTYSVMNPKVPDNEDAVAWLLKTHQGYCTYYATAMTIMARMMGIPARIANGFTQGNFDRQHKSGVVNGENAHSWVQVYFPGFGWIKFDPTPGFSDTNGLTAQPSPAPVKTQPPTRPTPIATAGHQKPGSKPTPAPGSTGTDTNTTSPSALARQNLFLALSLATLLGSVVIFCFALLFRYKGYKLSASITASTIFRRVCRLGALIGSPPQRWQTPYEYYRMLGRRFPQAATPLRRVTELFVRERWAAPHQVPGPAEEQALEKLWPPLRNTLIRSFLSRRGG